MKGLRAIEEVLSASLRRCFPQLEDLEIGLRPPADYQQGDLATAICIRAGQRLKKTAPDIGKSIIEALPSEFEPEAYMLDEQLTLRLPPRLEWLMGEEGEAGLFPFACFIVAIPPLELFASRAEYLRVCALGLYGAQLAKRAAGKVQFYDGTSLAPAGEPEAIFRRALSLPADGEPARKVSALCDSLSRQQGGMLILASSALISNEQFADWIAAERGRKRTARVKLIEPDWYGSSASYFNGEDLRSMNAEELRTVLFHLASELRPWELDITACLRGEFHPPRERINELALRLSKVERDWAGPDEGMLKGNVWLRELILDARFHPVRLRRALFEGELMTFNLALARLIRQTTRLLNQPRMLSAAEAAGACFFSNWLNSRIGQAVGDMLEVFESSERLYVSCPGTENKSYGEVNAKQ